MQKKLSLGIMGAVNAEANTVMRKNILPSLLNDLVGNVARHDFVIVFYGNWASERHLYRNQYALIRYHLRILANLLLVIRGRTQEIIELLDVFEPGFWVIVRDSMLEICQFYRNEEGLPMLKVPYNADLLVMLFNRIIPQLKKYFIQTEQRKKLRQLGEFEECYKADYNVYLIRKSAFTRKALQREINDPELPSTSDINIFLEWITGKQKSCMDYLKNAFCAREYQNLLNYTVVYLMVSNFRRPGEFSRTYLQDYTNKKQIRVDDELFKRMNNKEKEQALKYVRIDIKGKKDDGESSYYLNKDNVGAIELLLKHREKFGILKSNPYLYALPSMDGNPKCINAYTVTVALANECSLTTNIDEKRMRATLFRKRAETNIEVDDELLVDEEILLRHFSHNKKTAQKHYRRGKDYTDTKVTKHLERLINPDNNGAKSKGSEADNDVGSVPHNDEIDDLAEEEIKDNDKNQDSLDDSLDEIKVKKTMTKKGKNIEAFHFKGNIVQGSNPG